MDLLDDLPSSDVALGPGAVVLGGFAARSAVSLLSDLQQVAAVARFRNMITPGGRRMSVAMTNCGRLGWVTDRDGYRYATLDPMSGREWPEMPATFRDLAARAAEAAGFGGFEPDACLINRYEVGSRLSLHQDRNESDLSSPIVSVSLGLPATFLWGGLQRGDRPRRIRLANGDIVVWGGPSRLAFHGIDVLAAGSHRLTGPVRYNLTFRRAG